MTFWKCEFCKHDVGPYHHDANACLRDFQFYAMHCDDFELKDRMGVLETTEWYKHEDLDRFLDTLDIELCSWQRTMLHTLAFKRPLYFEAARGSNHDLSAIAMILYAYEASKKSNQSQN